ncbi:MAG: sigma-70 family RNA polymerase sigma factor [Tissierellaceae bacterium]|nr:sigma-70 family RNA polymerase sigma factor [Tissierellaceae bacterium]
MIYQKYNKDFLRFATSLTKNEEKAMDLVQDTYVSGLEHEEVFESMNEYQIKGWFFTTIKNKNIDNIRKQNRIILIEDETLIEDSDSFEEMVVIRELIDRLPENQKQVITLKYILNLNSSEIGEMLGISPSTVRSRLSAAIKNLKEKL